MSKEKQACEEIAGKGIESKKGTGEELIKEVAKTILCVIKVLF